MKKDKKNKLFFLFLLLFIFVLGANFVLAQRELEIDYPVIPGAEVTLQTVEGTSLPEYVKYIFNFAIGIVGLLALGALIYGGMRYLTSAGNPAVLEDARSQIFAGVLGLIILLSSYLILTTINPQLVVFEFKEIGGVGVGATPGVWVCKEETFDAKHCYRVTTVQNLPNEFNNKIKYVYIVEEGGYGAVLHEDENFKGKCQVVLKDQSVKGKPSSVTPFIINPGSEGKGVTLYEKSDFNEGFEGKDQWPLDGGYKAGNYPGINAIPCYSIEIKETEQYIAVVFEDTNYRNRCQVFNRSDRNLEDDYISYFCGWWLSRKPCVSSMKVIEGKIIGKLAF